MKTAIARRSFRAAALTPIFTLTFACGDNFYVPGLEVGYGCDVVPAPEAGGPEEEEAGYEVGHRYRA